VEAQVMSTAGLPMLPAGGPPRSTRQWSSAAP
jgi:hypothetical protein